MPTKIQQFNGRVYETRVELHPGDEPFVFTFATSGAAMLRVRAKGPGVSALVEYTVDPSDMLAAGTAAFDPSPIATDGLVINAVAASEIIAPLTALRVTAYGGTVIVGVLQ